MAQATVKKDINVAAAGRGASEDAEKKAAENLAKYRAALDAKYAKEKAAREKKEQDKLLKLKAQGKDAQAEKLRAKSKKAEDKIQKDLAKEKQKYQDILQKEKDRQEKQSEKDALNRRKDAQRELAEQQEDDARKAAQRLKDTNAATKAAFSALSTTVNALNDSVTNYLGTYSEYMSKVNARLQGVGSNFNYETINDTIRKNTAASPYVKYTDVMENLANLVDLGIADNLTQRAFLDTISDKIATTFDAAESSLLNIIRIQQKDSTASRLGMEAELTKLFNYYFSDTSYLSDAFDTVQATLTDVSSYLGAEASVELEYMVQKWLGALGSVGVSTETLTTIAQGINYIGSGDINSLTSNESLQNLFVLAANRKGQNINKMLTEGISASEANTLLESIVEYVQEISQEENNVVRKQYAELFGLSMSDMKAFQNISDEVLSALYSSAMSYQDTLTELDDQLGQVGSRMHLSEKIDNILDNVLAATGLGVANSQVGYATWKSFDMLEKLTGGIELPFITAFGNGLDLNMSLEGLGKSLIIGISAAASMVEGISNLANGAGLELSRWATGPDKSGGFTGYQSAKTLKTTKSSTNYVSSGSNLGIQESLSDSQKETGEEVSGTEQGDSERMMEILEEILAIESFLQSYFKSGGEGNTPLQVTLQSIGAEVQSSMGVTPFYTYNEGGV